MGLPAIVEGLAKRYKKNFVIRSLVQLIPFGIGSAADTTIVTLVENIREDRVRTFFDELAAGKVELKQELLENEEFLHCYFATVSAALRSYRKEKIRMFARLLKKSTLPDSLSNIDEYEEYLGILDELSYREILVLNLLDKYESKFPQEKDKNDLERANRFWDEFTKELEESLQVPQDEIDAVLTRLNRTGCYETFIGTYAGYTGGKGKLTATYRRLKSLVSESEDLDA